MKEFMGLVTYPFRFSTSFLLVSAGRSTHAFMSRTGILSMSFVKMLKGAVSLGVFGFSFLPFAFFDFAVALGRALRLSGGFGTIIGRPLRVLLLSSSSIPDLGVGGDPENIAELFCNYMSAE